MPLWSPDGSYIAIQTAAHDNYDIQLVRTADHRRTVVAGTAVFEGQYSWSSQGNRLAFISSRDGSDAMYVTDVTGRELKRLTMTSTLNPAWSP
jgi:Tol biopolymer transport system component